MTTVKEQIYRLLVEHPGLSAQEITEKCNGKFGGRTYVSRILAQLISEHRVHSEKHGRNVIYFVSDKIIALEENLNLIGLKEDEIWTKVRKSTDFLSDISENAENILYFAFTEMLNNAIDHSRSGVGYVKIWLEDDKLKFIVKDNGVGVFKNVMVSRHLDNEVDAARELVKGKLTTQPGWHSGEGIFWTSKIADQFSLESYDYKLIINNTIDDYAIKKIDSPLVGTEVYFEITKDTTKSLQALFRDLSFDHNHLSLDTTVIPVKLFDEGEIWISRSQAKKILTGLEKYKKIIFDFAGIEVIGQAFADEIFRVFNIHHPNIELEPINMSESVKLMVHHAINDPTGRSNP